MKLKGRIIIVVLISICCLYIGTHAQDTIVRKNGNEIIAKVTRITPEIVEYYKYGRADGPLYSEYKIDLIMIKYPDGTKDIFETIAENKSIEDKENVKVEITENVFIDERDGMEYKIIQIGEQTWMTENLKYKTEKSRCYKDEDSNCEECGQYYNFEEANEACPDGWHLPTDNEWMELEMESGMSYTEVVKKGWRGSGKGQAKDLLIGGKTGLELEFCGYNDQRFHYKGIEGAYWTSTAVGKSTTWIRHFKRRASINRATEYKFYLNTVRCLKDSNKENN